MRSNSGLNFSNISAGFAGASNALSQGVDIKSREMLEEMKDARAENLSRMNWVRDMYKQKDMLDRQSTLQQSSQKFSEEMETRREGAAHDRQESSQRAYYGQLDARTAAATTAAEAARKAEIALQNQREDAGTQRQMRVLMADDANRTQQEISRIDSQKAELLKQYTAASSSNMAMRVVTDPQKRATMAANDPNLQAILKQMSDLDNERMGVIRAHAVTQDGYGNPNFKGALTSQPAQPDNSGGVPSLISSSGGGAATPNNPSEPANQLPRYPTDSAADNTPAISRPSFTGAPQWSPPGSSPAGMPPTAGYSVRAPVTSMVGPLRPGPQLIPNAGSAMPGINTPAGAGAFPGIGNPTGAPPSLIPPQGY